MSELGQVYEAHETEAAMTALWVERGAFDAEPDDPGEPYCIVIPPPNVTAALHLGHAFNNTLQDVLIRYHRMAGRNALWMPGTDHAGIATQTVVEKRLLAEEGKRRTDYPREEFVARVQAWKEEYEATILGQLKAIGASCDWRRTRFTMDEVCAAAVRENFHRLFADGLIYRGKRLVNWDPATQTVLADDEVEHEPVDGHMWYLRYPLAEPVKAGGERVEHVTVATTRPETMLGDTAVAMNPRDPRADALVGRTVRLPLVGREIPVVADDHVVLPDPEGEDAKARYSTGFLKVTPAHDPDDYQIGLRHDLEMINVMAPDGSISDRHGWHDAAGTEAESLVGMDRFDARREIVDRFRAAGLLAEVRDYAHEVGHSYRSHVPIEPYLSDQWYVAVRRPVDSLPGSGTVGDTDLPVNSLAGTALEPLEDGRLRFVPERYASTYRTWLANLRDWPISRQLWWGHRIPVWSRTVEAEGPAEPVDGSALPDGVRRALDAAAGEPFLDALAGCGERAAVRAAADAEEPGLTHVHVNLARDHEDAHALLERAGFVLDEDVLDTWFSSALWPFSTLGWPTDTPELAAWFPGAVLSTGRDIITLWVSRMVMMGRYCAGDIPFGDVFIHAMILDGDGRKMSKTLGNGIDPLTVIDSHGADAMRFTLVQMATQTQDVRMPVEEIELPDGRTVNSSPKFTLGRNFCNKLWNATRFALLNLDDTPAWDAVDVRAHLADRWVLSRLQDTVASVTAALQGYRFNEAADVLYHFTWDDVCDWYLEIAKARIADGDAAPKAVLAHVLDHILRLLHPVSPFLTERLWQALGDTVPARGPSGAGEPLLARAAWPGPDDSLRDAAAETDFDAVREVVREIRNVRAHHGVAPGRRLTALLEGTGEARRLLEENTGLVGSQARLEELRPAEGDEVDARAATVPVAGIKIHLLDVIDVEAERDRLGKNRDKLARSIAGARGKLSNEGFTANAPEAVVAAERDKLTRMEAELAEVERLLEALDG